MLRLAPLVALLASALLASPAYAQDGSGLYQPFPGGNSAGLAKRYLDRLPALDAQELTLAEVRGGVFMARRPEATIRTASARAGRRDEGGRSLPPVLSLGIVALAAGGGFALASHRR